MELLKPNLNDSWIKNNRAAVNAHVMELSSASYPLLLAYLRHLRKLNGVHNVFDDKNETEEMIKEYEYAYNHDLLFYLTVTRQYDLIHNLFSGNKPLASLLRLIGDIEEEQKHKNRQERDSQFLEERLEALAEEQKKIYQQQTKAHGRFNSLLMYEYYETMHKKAFVQHYTNLTTIFDTAYSNRIARMNEACKAVLGNPAVSTADKKKLLDLRREYRREYERIKSIPTTNPDNSYNFEAAEQQVAELENLENDFNKRFETTLEEISSKTNNSALQEKLNTILQTEREDSKHTKEEVVVEKQRFSEEDREINHHKQETKEETVVILSQLTKEIKNLPLEKLSEQQRNQYITAIERLEGTYGSFKQIENHTHQKEFLKHYAETFNEIKKLVEPVLSKEEKQALDEGSNLLHQLTDAISKMDMMLEHLNLTINDSIQEIQSASNVHQIQNDHEILAADDNTHSIIDLQREIKRKIHDQSTYNHPPSRLEEEDFNALKEQFIKIADELKNQLEKDMDTIDFSEEDLDTYELISPLIENLINNSDSKESSSQFISQLLNTAELLKEKSEKVARIKNQLDEVSQKLNSCIEQDEKNSLGRSFS